MMMMAMMPRGNDKERKGQNVVRCTKWLEGTLSADYIIHKDSIVFSTHPKIMA